MSYRWLKTEGGIAPCPCCKIGGRKIGFLERTLVEVTSFFRNGLFSEEYAKKNGILQRIDPRVKILTLGILLVAVSLMRHLTLIGGLYLTVLFLAILSKIDLKFFLPRVWLFIPLFSGIIAIPALFNVFVPGEPLLTLITFKSKWSVGLFEIPKTISITKQGLFVATMFVMRVATSVSLVVLIVLTTRWQYLLKALRVLWVPQMFTFIIGMTCRYIHLLLKLIEDIHLAKKSRVIKKTSVVAGQRWVTSQIGNILKRSLQMSEEVHSAMLSRGFTNDVRILDTFRIKRVDYVWAAFFILFTSVILGFNSILG